MFNVATVPLEAVTDALADAEQRHQSELNALRAAGRAATERAYEELEAFKLKVRAVALEVKENNGWCDDGFNKVMDELNLERLVRHWVGTATVRVSVVNTDSEYTARGWVRHALHSTDDDVQFVDVLDLELEEDTDY